MLTDIQAPGLRVGHGRLSITDKSYLNINLESQVAEITSHYTPKKTVIETK